MKISITILLNEETGKIKTFFPESVFLQWEDYPKEKLPKGLGELEKLFTECEEVAKKHGEALRY